MEEQTVEGVGQVAEGTDETSDLDAMPEETPDQPADTTLAGTPAPEVPELPEGLTAEDLTPEQVAKYKEAHENYHKWAKSNTEEAQRIAEERRAIQQEREQMMAFRNDPVTQRLWATYQQVQQNPELLNDIESFNEWIASKQGAQAAPGVAPQLLNRVQTLEQTLAQQRQAAYEQEMAEAKLAADNAVKSFREGHADMFPDTPEGDAAFGEFYNKAYVPSGVVDLESAFKIYDYDGAQARARQAAQGEVDAVDAEKANAASTVVPGSHTPDIVEGDPHDTNFEGARQRSMALYNLGLGDD